MSHHVNRRIQLPWSDQQQIHRKDNRYFIKSFIPYLIPAVLALLSQSFGISSFFQRRNDLHSRLVVHTYVGILKQKDLLAHIFLYEWF